MKEFSNESNFVTGNLIDPPQQFIRDRGVVDRYNIISVIANCHTFF